MNQQGQTDKMQAVQQLAGIAQKALTITDPVQRKGFLQQAGQIYGPAFQALGADMSQFPAMLQMPDDQLSQRLQQVAQFAAPQAPIKLGPDETLLTPPAVPGGQFTTVAIGTPKDNIDYKDAGDRLVPVDKRTGQPVSGLQPINKGMPPSSGYTQDSVDTTAQMIASNQIPMLSGFALKTPWGQAVVARVGQIAPDYQGGQYGAQAATLKAFSSGTESRSVRSLNVAISHLDTLSELSQALNSGNIQALNKVAVRWKTETGNPAPTSFTSARDIVANEVVKAVTASGGTLADRQEAQTQIQAAASPAQLAGVIQTWKQLLGGQLGGLQQQYEQGTGQKDFQRFLSPNVVKQLEGSQGASAQAPAADAVPTATGPGGQKLYLRNGQWVSQ
jgi:hypothetical protein